MNLVIPTLETKRLLLRPYDESSREGFVALNTDSIVRQHMDGPLSPDSASGLFDQILSRDAASNCVVWAVIERSSRAYIGHAIFDLESERPDVSIGFLFFMPYWGRGFGTEVARCLVAYGFDQVGRSRLVATVDVDHAPSIRVLEKAGFNLEATMHDDDGAYYVYAVARETYSEK